MSGSTAVRNDPAAHDLLRGAQLTDYHFPDGFAGFSAEITYADAESQAVGAAAVRTPNEVMLEIDASQPAMEWIRRELSSMAAHRWPFEYEQGDGQLSLTFGANDGHPLGRLIEANGSRFALSYRVNEGRIVQINRQMGETRFSVNILEHVQTADTRLLPTYFTVSYWDVPGGRLIRSNAYSDRFALHEGILLPASRRVITVDDTGVTVRELTLTGYQLLPPA
jgi:hypothetical protein